MELETTLFSTFATNTKASWSEYPTPYVGFSAMLTGVAIMLLCAYLFVRNVTPTFHVLAVFLFLSILVGMQWTWSGFRTLSPARRTDSISANAIKAEMSSFHALAEAAQMYHRVGYQDELLSVDLSINSDRTSYVAVSVVFFLSLYIILAGMHPALFPLTWVSILLIPITSILVLLIPFGMANRERARVLNKCLAAENANSLLDLITKPWGGPISFLKQCRACGPDIDKPLALYHHNWYSILALFVPFATLLAGYFGLLTRHNPDALIMAGVMGVVVWVLLLAVRSHWYSAWTIDQLEFPCRYYPLRRMCSDITRTFGLH